MRKSAHRKEHLATVAQKVETFIVFTAASPFLDPARFMHYIVCDLATTRQ
jgi:hypothetical protein